MSRHDEPLNDDETPEQKTKRAIDFFMKQGLDEATARDIVEDIRKELKRKVDPGTADSEVFLHIADSLMAYYSM
jgi:hypothetical protein